MNEKELQDGDIDVIMAPATPLGPTWSTWRTRVGHPRGAGQLGSDGAARLATAAIGFLPVTLISASAFGLTDLRTLAVLVLMPALVAGAVVLAGRRHQARLLAASLVAGIISTFLHDTFRFGLIGAGLIDGDPIPNIGEALEVSPPWLFGYLWRYLGNGTGLALAFFALGLRSARVGVLYGLCICSGLLVTLAISPYGAQLLFSLTVTNGAMATGGHVIFGATLGWMADRFHARQNARAAPATRTP